MSFQLKRRTGRGGDEAEMIAKKRAAVYIRDKTVSFWGGRSEATKSANGAGKYSSGGEWRGRRRRGGDGA